MLNKLFKGRYSVLFSFLTVFVFISFLIRTILFIDSIGKTDFSFFGVMRIYLLGFVYDIGVGLFLTAFYSLYLLFFPDRWFGSIVNKIITYAGLFLALLISFFSFFAELTFWQEF